MRKMRKEREETHTYIVVSETSLGRSSFLILNENSLLLLRYELEERVRKLGCLISVLMFEMLIRHSLLFMNQICLKYF